MKINGGTKPKCETFHESKTHRMHSQCLVKVIVL